MKKLLIACALMVGMNLFMFAGANEDLVIAIKTGNIEAVKAAVANGADVNHISGVGTVDANGMLNHAIFSIEITKFLLESGADPNIGGAVPPLSGAAIVMSTDVMKALIAAGADVSKGGLMSPLNAAIMSGCKECLEVLAAPNVNVAIDAKADPNGEQMRKFVFEAREGAPLVPSSLIPIFESKGYKVPDWYRNMDKSKFQPSSLSDQLESLIKGGYGINGKYTNLFGGKSPLMGGLQSNWPSHPDHEARLLLLVKAGADVKEVDEKWGSVLNLAIRKGYLNLVKAIVEGGADINAESKEYDEKAGQYIKGFTPLTVAAMTEKLDIVTYLLGAGSKPSEGVFGFSFNFKTNCATTVTNKTAIYYAIENGNLPMVKVLVEKGEFNWDLKPFKMNQMKQSSTNYGYNVTTTITKCTSDGAYFPASYAKACGQVEIRAYLKEKYPNWK